MPARPNAPVRVAIIGTGGITQAHGVGYLQHSRKIRCAALVDVSQENLQKRAEHLASHKPRVFSDWKQMLNEMGVEIDAVDICLPHHLHAAAILDAAGAGKHILCEKPMCTTLAEADEILAAVKNAGVTYMSAHNQLLLPAVREAKKMLLDGAIGPIFWLRSQDCFTAKGGRDDWGWRANLQTQGGGVLIDTGYHPSYRLLHLAGSKPVAISGIMGRFHNSIDGEDAAAVHVRFENGALGEMLASWAFALPSGTHQVHVVGKSGQIFGSENYLYHLPAGASEPKKMTFEPVDTFAAQMEHFADCLIEGKRPIHGPEEGKAVLELILNATQSADGWQPNAFLKL